MSAKGQTSPRRILFVLDKTLMGGAERHCFALAQALQARGHICRIVVLFKGGALNFPIKTYGVDVVELQGSGLASVAGLKTLGNQFLDFAPQLVFGINQTALIACLLARYLSKQKAKLACIFHTTVISTVLGKLKVTIFKALVRLSDVLIYVSENQAKYWDQKGLRAPYVKVIQNGIDPRVFTPASTEDRARLRTRLGYLDNDLVIVLCGRFAPEKNHAQLVRALPLLLKHSPRFRLLFIGDGPMRAETEALSVQLCVDDRTDFVGSHTDVRSWLGAADIGCLVSTSVETFSLAALEMMAMQLAVVLSDTGGASEIIVQGESGYLFPVGDSQALISALLRLERDEQNRRDMGAQARHRVLSHFTHDQMVEQYEALIYAIPLDLAVPLNLEGHGRAG